MLRTLTLVILSAILLIFSFPNFSAVGGSAFGGNLWILSWFGFVPLFFALQGKSKLKAFLLAYLAGFIFWLGTIYWLIHVTLSGMIILALYLALYFGIFGVVIRSYKLEVMSYELLFIPSIWVLLEYIRAHLFTGFPWALLGYSQYRNLPVIQIADITGAYGVSFLAMMANVFIYRVAGDGWRVTGKKIILPCLLLFLSLGYGFYKLSRTPHPAPRTPLKISVIQGNIPQEVKWDPAAKDFIIDAYLSLTRQAIKDKPDLIIWPEASLPVVLEEEPSFFEKVRNLAKEINTPLLLGTVTTKDNLYHNSAILVSKDGRDIAKYDKLHLVPFGEFIPLRKTLRFLETIVPIGDFTAGKEYTVFSLPATRYPLPAKFSVLICFEDLFPGLSREFRKKGADFLVNITNDAWFGRTASPYQHICASVFRAVENRLFLVRAANTGVSGFIAPSGKIISLVKDNAGKNIFIGGFATGGIRITKGILSFYSRFGDIFVAVCCLFVLYGIMRKSK